MTDSGPDWVDDPNPCPDDDCEGVWYIDIGGSDAGPIKVYRTTCHHNVEKCAECENVVLSIGARRYEWVERNPPLGGTAGGNHITICNDCRDAETVQKWVPQWVLDGFYGGGPDE